jgi:hypothetical protein
LNKIRKVSYISTGTSEDVLQKYYIFLGEHAHAFF